MENNFKNFNNVLIGIHQYMDMKNFNEKNFNFILEKLLDNYGIEKDFFNKHYKKSSYYNNLSHYNGENISDYSKIIKDKQRFKLSVSNIINNLSESSKLIRKNKIKLS